MIQSMRLVALIFASALSSMLIPQQLTSTYQLYASESSPYDSGYDHGCDDAGRSESDKYINQPEKGPSFHTSEFMNGYYAGLSACSSGEGDDGNSRGRNNGGSDDGSTQPMQGGIDWITVCDNLQAALVSSCDILVNPDNSLTMEGERAVDCIRNGFLLAGGGSFLLSSPLPLVISALQILEEPTGCGGIVEWGLIGSVNDLDGIISLLT